MGRATIVSGGDDGLYTATTIYNTAERVLDAIDADIAQAEELIEQCEEEIAAREAEVAELRPELSEAGANFNLALANYQNTGGDAGENLTHPHSEQDPSGHQDGSGYPSLEPFDTSGWDAVSSALDDTNFGFDSVSRALEGQNFGFTAVSEAIESFGQYELYVYLQSAPEYNHDDLNDAFSNLINVLAKIKVYLDRIVAVEKYRDMQEYIKEELEHRRAELLAATASGDPGPMWCADLSEDLAGEADTIEIDGAPVHAVIIAPGGAATLRDENDRPGLLSNVMALSVAGCALAWTLLPGWQKWRPTYRVGAVQTIDYDADTAVVTLDAAASVAQNLDINQALVLTDIPVDYMECDASAFEVGDRVVVEFPGQLWGTGPKVIGFEDHPQPCPDNIVLLVEMGAGPAAFAVFAPLTETGHAPGMAGVANLELVGWTNNLLDESQDPLGIVGQTTYRQRWATMEDIEEEEPGEPEEPEEPEEDDGQVRVEQLKRVDQGYGAYTGRPELEEVTECGTYSSLWTYEDIPFTTWWESVEPGPPPPEICGYTWDVYAEYGGAGEAEYHDETHLFYRVNLGGGDKAVYVWPPEFSQLIKEWQFYNEEGAVFRFVDYDHPGWDSVEMFGIQGAVGSIVFENTLTVERVTLNRNRRVWGAVYGTVTFSLKDYGNSEHPFTTYALADDRTSQISTDFRRRFITDGVYIKDYVYCFVQGLVRSGSGWSSQLYNFRRREAIDPAAEFEHPEDLTERQLEILAGNEDSCLSWVYDPFRDQYECGETTTTKPALDVVVNCQGTEFVIETGVDFDTPVTFHDYGIFTKPDTGVTEENVIVADTVQPVYAFSVEIGGTEIIYGMVKDGELFITEKFAKAAVGEYTVPGVEAAVDAEGAPVTCSQWVRLAKSAERLRPDA